MSEEANPFTGGGHDEEFGGEVVPEEIMPEGICIAQVLNVEKAKSKTSGNDMFVWTMGIQEYIDPVEEGKNWISETLKVYTSLSKAASWKLEETLTALGIQIKNGKFNFKKDDVLGVCCQASIKHDEYNGRPRPAIDAMAVMDGGPVKRELAGFAHSSGGAAVDDIPF